MATEKDCIGAGRRWMPGMGRAVCPVCKGSWKIIGGSKPRKQLRKNLFTADSLVPAHTDRRAT